MGSKSNISWWYVIVVNIWFMILSVSCFTTISLPILANNNTTTNIDTSSIDDNLYKYSLNSISKRPRTGVLLNVSLPSNYSGLEVSIVRLRSRTMWAKGANFSTFDIPARVMTMPYVRRLAIMYENFGNLSSQYYELPGYTILSSILGFAIYNATDLSSKTSPQRLNFTVAGEPIKLRFPDDQVKLLPQGKDVKLIKCVRFDPINGLVVLSNTIEPNVCIARALGQFALAIPGEVVPQSPPTPPPWMPKDRKGRKNAVWKGWLIGFGAGIVGLMLLISGSVICYKTVGFRKIAKMERKSEKSESLDTRWIGTSKMPSAPVTRTQAVLENDLAP